MVPVEKNTFHGKKFSPLVQKYCISREEIFVGGKRYGFPCINKKITSLGKRVFAEKQ